MDLFSILTLIGGLAFFLYGISIMSSGLEKIAGGKLEKLLKKMTSSPIKGLLLGAGITAVIQSSSATTVMLIGLVNSGLMDLSQTISVIIGTNIGTTITAWILSLSGIQEGASFILKLLKPESFTPLLAFIGVCMIMAAKSNRNKSVGSVMVGFAILMFGMGLMSSSMAPLSQNDDFRNAMVTFTNPLLGFLVGLIITIIIQSSSASVGILQALSMVGGVTWGAAIPIILGQNLGTCISAVLASIGVCTNAKRVAAVHVIFNSIGAIILLPLFYLANAIFKFSFVDTDINPVGIAIVHSTYNILTAIMLFNFIKFIEKLAIKVVPETKKEAEKKIFLDERLLNTPTLAISECFTKTIEMAEIVRYNYITSTKMLKSFHRKKVDEIHENELEIDKFEDYLNSYLLKLSGRELTEADNNKISQVMLAIGDFERIGDHATNILKYAEKLNDSETKFSEEAVEEIKTIVGAVSEIYDMTLDCYKTDDLELAQKIEPLEAVIKKGVKRAKNNHIQRLQNGQCSAEKSFMFSDLLNDLRRIAAHCGNIATGVIQLHDITINKHEYNHRNKDEDMEFKNRYRDYKSRYRVIKRNKEAISSK
ncbi:TPA: Na/Pi cotransporter family protein [Candidatus Avigastranaerophilus faecigallinarum]|nr:Na/Pi cotransporter family protein [Candidatus Avigastranaerophilus faecigallinarum]